MDMQSGLEFRSSQKGNKSGFPLSGHETVLSCKQQAFVRQQFRCLCLRQSLTFSALNLNTSRRQFEINFLYFQEI